MFIIANLETWNCIPNTFFTHSKLYYFVNVGIRAFTLAKKWRVFFEKESLFHVWSIVRRRKSRFVKVVVRLKISVRGGCQVPKKSWPHTWDACLWMTQGQPIETNPWFPLNTRIICPWPKAFEWNCGKKGTNRDAKERKMVSITSSWNGRSQLIGGKACS